MLTLTQEAAHAIRCMTEAPVADGVRIHAGSRFSHGHAPRLQIEIAEGPEPEDMVLEAEGARLYLEPETLEALDDKVLDADAAGDEPRFAILEQPDATAD
jgi:Fe-S cluster assembly iron-binding protein IscA